MATYVKSSSELGLETLARWAQEEAIASGVDPQMLFWEYNEETGDWEAVITASFGPQRMVRRGTGPWEQAQ